jgi:type IV fimbrial biogenesis protein FimT
MLSRRQQGVTLVELMITVVIGALLLALGVPAFSEWIVNTQNRTAAESLLNGLQLARTEAVRRNTEVRLTLTDSGGRVAWTVGCVNATDDCPATIQARPAEEGSSQSRVAVSEEDIPLPTPAGHFDAPLTAATELVGGVSFDGLGRVKQSSTAGTNFTRADVSSAAMADARRYVVIVGAGGQLRMCDPKLAFASNPQGCS